MGARRVWTNEEIELLEYCYEDTPTAELAELLERSVARVLAKAHSLGLKKGKATIAEVSRARMMNPDHPGRKSQFKPGLVPHNKGRRIPGWTRGRMAETQFKKGQRPHTWKPIGTTRLNADGYLDLKISDTGYPPRDWVGAHILLWEDKHGPIPPNHVVVFKDGDKRNVKLKNLELVCRAELMRRNSIHKVLPKELVQIILLNGALKRKLRRLDRAEEQNVRSA